jgi:ATP-dependent phosphofructokinase / diphosphate-dependent phosphofructokinase
VVSAVAKFRIAINTGGGDAPGLNAVIRAVVRSATGRGWEVYGIQRGYNGLLHPESGGIEELTVRSVRGITHLGGTILGSTNKGDPFDFPMEQADGSIKAVDLSDRIVQNFKRFGFDALIACGGDGSMSIAHRLGQKGLRVVGVPKTIDNDLHGTVVTFGFDTAVTTATDAIDKLHTTAEAHDRVMVVEVMGRYAGWIALNSGVSGTADAILLPEIPYDIDKVCSKIMERELHGLRFAIVVVAEGARPKDGERSVVQGADIGKAERLGGAGKVVGELIRERTGKDVRVVVLGHLQRGGRPTTFDRLLGLRFGSAAVRLIERGEFGQMVVLDPPQMRSIPLEEAAARTKIVPLDCDTILTAREMGMCLGD